MTLKRPTPCQRSKTAHKPKRAAGGQATEGRTVSYRRETEQPADNVVAHFLKTEVSAWPSATASGFGSVSIPVNPRLALTYVFQTHEFNMPEYSFDYETRSRCDLRKVGAFRYAYDADTEILCFSLLKENEEPRIWVPKKWRYIVEGHLPLVPDHELAELSKPDAVVSAFNAPFECAITDALFKKTTGHAPIRHDQWRCVASMARRAALPGSLEKLGEVLKLTAQKFAQGKSLIQKFSVPQSIGKKKGQFIDPSDDPKAFIDFCAYCLQDARAEREAKLLLKDFELKGASLRAFQLTLDINTRGFPVNLDALQKAEVLVAEETKRLIPKFRALTGLNPTQGKKLLAWLQERGFKHKNLKAETLDEFFEEYDAELDEATLIGKVLTIKRRIGFAALKKIPAMLACAGPYDNRVRGMLVDHGAGTGRWTAEKVQPQNFKKPVPYMEFLSKQAYQDICDGCNVDWLELAYGPPLEVIASCIRHFIQDDKNMVGADFSSVESRLMAWQTQEPWKLEVCRTHGKIYEALACQMFGLTMADMDAFKKKHGKHHPARQKAKPAELSLQYLGSEKAMIRMGALKQGLTEEELPEIVRAWREAHPCTRKMWNDIREAYTNAVKNVGRVYPFGVDCSFFSTHTAGMKFLFMKLPSGRKIAYPQPKLEPQLSWQEETTKRVTELDENGKERVVLKKVKGDFKKILNPTPEQIAKIRQKYPKARISEALTVLGQIKKQWCRIPIHQGVCCNNCITGENEVLTAKGWLRLDALTDEKVWDGVEFVDHQGLINQGFQEVIDCHGVLCTPDHEFLVGEQWVTAEKACKLRSIEVSLLDYECKARTYREKIRTTACDRLLPFRWAEELLESIVSVREGIGKSWTRFKPPEDKLRKTVRSLQEQHVQADAQARYDLPPYLDRVGQYAAAVQQTRPSSLPQLRRSGYQGLRQVAPFFRQLFSRHGSNLEEETGHRSSGQQCRVLTGKLPLGDTQDQLPKQTPFGAEVGSGNRREERHKAYHTSLETEERRKTRGSVLQEGRLSRQVFDIRNCGPRHRFVVRSPRTGLLLVAHNCIQGIAADFMISGTLNLLEAGYGVVALIHDEALSEYDPLAGQSADHFVECLTKLPPWAEGMPLAAEGGCVEFYQK